MKKNRILNILIIVILLILTGVFVSVKLTQYKSDKIKEEYDNMETAKRIPTDDNSITVMTYSEPVYGEEDVVLSHDDFSAEFKRTSFYSGEATVEYRFSKTLYTSENLYLLKFKMKSEESAVKVNVEFGDEHVFYITPTLHEYYFPCSSSEINRIKWTLKSDYQRLYLYDVEVFKYSKNGLNFSKIKAGTYTFPQLTTVNIPSKDGMGAKKAMDVVGDGTYLYSGGNDVLTVFETESNSIISTLNGIGNIRHFSFVNEKILAAASRENGVLLINIDNKTNPYIISRYDSLEIANDVCFSGDYMFVASRYFGVEIVDISDIENPKMVNRIVNEEECFRCLIKDNYLFVGCWSSGTVEIYDVENILKPTLISTVSVNGRCAGMFVDGDHLYVASGYKDSVNADNVGDIGYATGNGVTVFDISDIEYPRWCSQIQAEGSLYGNGYDDWNVQVSKGYLYFTNSFGGIYIYDVTDLHNPKPVMNLRVPLYPSDEEFADFSKSTTHVFPYDITEYIVSPVMGLHVDNSAIYFACAYNDIYHFPFEQARFVPENAEAFTFKKEGPKVTRRKDYKQLLTEYDVYAIEKFANDRYLIATSEGIILCDKELNVIDKFTTQNPVKDIKVFSNSVIVTAEKYLVSTYKVENDKIIHYGSVNSNVPNTNISSLGLTGDGMFAIVQSSWTRLEAVNLSDINNPQLVQSVMSVNGSEIPFSNVSSPGNMYYRNIVSGTIDGAVGVSGGKTFIWFESDGSMLRVVNRYTNKFAGETNGSAVLEDTSEVLSVYNNGYMVYNPLEITDQDVNALPRYFVRNLRIKGKATIDGDILVVTNAPNGFVYILDISDAYNPYLIQYYDTESSLGLSLVDGDSIFIPVRHGGIVKIELYY